MNFCFQSLVVFIIILIPSTRKRYRYMYNFAGNFLYSNCETSPSKNIVCDRMAIYLVTSTSKVLVLIVFSFSFITCGPIYKNLFTDDSEMIIPVILPFIDPETENGFYANLTSQLISSAFGAIAVPAIEVVTCVLKNTVSTSAAIIADSLIEFKNGLAHDGNFTDKRIWLFRNIIMKILDFNRFYLT